MGNFFCSFRYECFKLGIIFVMGRDWVGHVVPALAPLGSFSSHSGESREYSSASLHYPSSSGALIRPPYRPAVPQPHDK